MSKDMPDNPRTLGETVTAEIRRKLVDGELALVAVVGGLGAHLHDLPGCEAGVRLRERAPDLGLHLAAYVLQY